MNLVDKLMQLDAGKLKLPTKQVEVPRLSQLFGEPFMVTCQALDPDTNADIIRMTTSYDKKGRPNVETFEMQVLNVIEGVIDPNFKDERLLKHFGAATPRDLVRKLFLPGEIIELSKTIDQLSGYQTDTEDIDELKNSLKQTQK